MDTKVLLILVLAEILELATLEEMRRLGILQRGRVLSVRWLQISEAAPSAGKMGVPQSALLDLEIIFLQNKLLT